jgi:hypothetical protein
MPFVSTTAIGKYGNDGFAANIAQIAIRSTFRIGGMDVV